MVKAPDFTLVPVVETWKWGILNPNVRIWIQKYSNLFQLREDHEDKRVMTSLHPHTKTIQNSTKILIFLWTPKLISLHILLQK